MFTVDFAGSILRGRYIFFLPTSDKPQPINWEVWFLVRLGRLSRSVERDDSLVDCVNCLSSFTG